MKRKQGFLEYKHAALNLWKAVLVLDSTELCLAVDNSVDPVGVGPPAFVCFKLFCAFCSTCSTADRMISWDLKKLYSEFD